MRELEPRAWDRQAKKMRQVAALYFESPDGKAYATIRLDKYTQLGGVCVGEDVDLLESTGLVDKHGKKVYEGDIVKVNGGDPKLEFISQVIFADAAFRIATAYDQGFPHKDDLEVIGNVYEHPHLLQQEAEIHNER